MTRRFLYALAPALALAGCATTLPVHTDADPAADLASYRTYNWALASPPAGMNPLLYQRVQRSIDRSLAAHSYTRGQPGDFAVAFTLGARDKVEVTDLGPYGPSYPGYGIRPWRTRWAMTYDPVDVRSVTEGTLAIDIYDAATMQPVWHGHTSKRITPGKVDQVEIDAAVDAILNEFPGGR